MIFKKDLFFIWFIFGELNPIANRIFLMDPWWNPAAEAQVSFFTRI